MEAWQHVQLTGTNSSIGLIYALKKIFSIKKNTFYKKIDINLQRLSNNPINLKVTDLKSILFEEK